MLGTGLSRSSSSESTIPSTTSSSWMVGMYCRQIGSSGDLMRSTIGGEIRNSKFSAAWRSAAWCSGGKCSGPNRSASASRLVIDRCRSSSCQVDVDLSGVRGSGDQGIGESGDQGIWGRGKALIPGYPDLLIPGSPDP